jgi:putative SOS response-associated peptidase YedK
MQPIHERMPVILESSALRLGWIPQAKPLLYSL